MPVAAELQPLLSMLESLDVKPMAQTTPAEMRAQFDMMSSAMPREVPEMADVSDRAVPGPAGEIPVRVYTPEGRGVRPVVAYFHGGGFVIGSIDTHDGTCREIASRSGCIVVSVDYRLAPEHPYPAAPDDCATVTRWIAESADALGADPGRLALAGDSAGGNLAAVTALRMRDEGGPEVALQVLVYPVIDAASDTPSYVENGEGYFLTAEAMAWFWRHYLPDPTLGSEPYVSPLRADDLSGLPPALILTAGFDPLRDEGERYAEALRAAGVEATLTRYDDMIHGFFSMVGVTPRADEAQDQVAAALRAL